MVVSAGKQLSRPKINAAIIARMPTYFTGRGDDGTTGWLGEGRIPKFGPRPEAYGTVDEASAALGVARSLAKAPAVAEVVIQIQRDLYHLMAEVASPKENASQFRKVDHVRVRWLEDQLERFGRQVELPSEFVVPGDSPAGAAFDLARTVVRRAERLVARLKAEGELENVDLLRYLNRLSSLCFVLELLENRQAGFEQPRLAKASD